MKRVFFRFLALFAPTRKLRDWIRAQGVDDQSLILDS